MPPQGSPLPRNDGQHGWSPSRGIPPAARSAKDKVDSIILIGLSPKVQQISDHEPGVTGALHISLSELALLVRRAHAVLLVFLEAVECIAGR